jgi:hypothetical protein
VGNGVDQEIGGQASSVVDKRLNEGDENGNGKDGDDDDDD